MPSSAEILAGLTRIAREAFALALLWHAVTAVALVALLRGWRPPSRWLAASLSLPLASVSALAWIYGNPFNGAVFAALAVALLVLAARAPEGPVERTHGAFAALGWAVLLYAWTYPHFLPDTSPLTRLVGAPMGVIPCPTLSLAIGVALVTGAPGGRGWSITLAGAGLLYAVIGVARLGVWLDVGLLAGAAALLALTLLRARRRREER